MIPERVKALFQFIDFLISNNENFQQYETEVKESDRLFQEQSELKRFENAYDKLKFEELQKRIDEIDSFLYSKIGLAIENKIIELNICNPQEVNPTLYNWNIGEIQHLKSNFQKEDVPALRGYCKKYFEYRANPSQYHKLNSFLHNLDELLNELFLYFFDLNNSSVAAFQKMENIKNYLSNLSKYIEGKSLSYEVLCNAENVMAVDEYCNDLQQSFQMMVDRGEINRDVIEEMKEMLQDILEIEIHNPLEESKRKINEYAKAKIKAIRVNLPTPPEALPPQQTKTEQDQQTENDFTLSTIEDWLFEFKEKMCETDYQTLVSALRQYFDMGTFPTLSKPIQINGRPNKKLFGWALNRIFEAKGKGIEKELLRFAKQNISLFTDVQFDETDIRNSNLYKYFTTQTK